MEIEFQRASRDPDDVVCKQAHHGLQSPWQPGRIQNDCDFCLLVWQELKGCWTVDAQSTSTGTVNHFDTEGKRQFVLQSP